MHALLTKAAQVAKAAEACAKAGSISESVQISLEIEQSVYEVGRLQDAASLLNRIGVYCDLIVPGANTRFGDV
jgi:hypothetical protein